MSQAVELMLSCWPDCIDRAASSELFQNCHHFDFRELRLVGENLLA